ncbi:uncharacterized protein LOC128218962 [Mya arenaria]|uniref:uncharacterized protein LOC128218962 n=1 Tax=Mya arenaria TaxID=6604 RepID=UPI0022E1BC38|nr:uncharacterized protein LOC128218962 [Mya arenaria]XP_052782705.1 uncharacterized protein LOC128218962 [Mya arenaria]XP_052782706.1 uncharacterized protein LOC128218962 [Mya arenaria]XP_052782707.1 uncharacterized protein LOC128218962 [Mya arenaria]XP_052782708.1 uncharacterized protein LOC128218962 [Mya arenaria]XP_052782710.1 uncharacterized protein LOC128218962 [Mya arenaria]XP_052782711.1 uncharacterized protein LOC128218962 [Mya arenaria]
MIISTVNFVNNYKFSDYILDRISEEQEKLEQQGEKGGRHSLHLPHNRTEADLQPRRRALVRTRTSDGSYKARPLSSPLTSPYTCAQNDHPLVTIETSNHFRLAADLTSLHVSLKKRDQPTVNNVFRQIDFGPDVNGKGRLMVFQLLSNPFYYLATSSYRHLEIQSYCDDTLDREVPDERFFRCFHSAVGAELIQPYAHPGYYIHHIDDFVNVRKLELNFRPPEEFFLDVKMCSNEEIQRLLISETDQYNTNAQRDSDVTSVDSKSGSLPRTAVPDIDKSSLKRKESKKLKGKPKDSPITPKASVLGCFRLKVFKKKKKDKTK